MLSLARFNLYALSYGFLIKQAVKGKRSKFWTFEVVGLVVFWAWFGWGVLGSLSGWREVVPYLLVSHILAAPVHVQVRRPILFPPLTLSTAADFLSRRRPLQIVLSHFSRSTEDLGVLESFAHRQLRTTMDVICSPSIEFIHGGLDKSVLLPPRLAPARHCPH